MFIIPTIKMLAKNRKALVHFILTQAFEIIYFLGKWSVELFAVLLAKILLM